MIEYPNIFRAELDKQIRRRGSCFVSFQLPDETYVSVYNSTIKSVDITLRNDPMCRELPTEECVISLIDINQTWNPDNPDGNYALVGAGTRAEIEIGIDDEDGVVWTGPVLTFFLTGHPEWSNNIATFHGTRQLGRLTNEFYQMGNSETLKSVAEKAVKSGLAEVGYDESDMEYSFESNLADKSVIENTALEGYTVANALMAVAFAAGKNLRTQFGGADGIIQIKDLVSASPQKTNTVVPRRDMFEIPVSDRLPLLRNEIVTYYKEPKAMAEQTIVLSYSGDEAAGSDKAFIPTDSPIIPNYFSIENATNVSGFIYARGKYRTGITMWGFTKQDPSLPITFDGRARPITVTPATVSVPINAGSEGEDEYIDNPLLNAGNYAAVAQYRADYLTNTRSKFQINYRGDPCIEPLDLIRVELPFVGFATCIVVESKFRYDSGFSGSLIVRKLDSVAPNQVISSAVSGAAISDEAVSDETI